MMCFKDMTYCDAKCSNTTCPRHIVNEAADRKLVGKSFDFLPTARSDFSDNCTLFLPVTQEQAKEGPGEH